MTGALDRFLREPLSFDDYPKFRTGRLVRFDRSVQSVLGRPTYHVHAVRGGWLFGRLEFRNQWQMYSYLHTDTTMPCNKLMIAEIYAMLKELDGL